eukprot:COSAG01_NODE_36969_length_510_cov_0.737226_2_plen_49_part_01
MGKVSVNPAFSHPSLQQGAWLWYEHVVFGAKAGGSPDPLVGVEEARIEF